MAKANIPIYRDMVELLKVLMREVKNMPMGINCYEIHAITEEGEVIFKRREVKTNDSTAEN